MLKVSKHLEPKKRFTISKYLSNRLLKVIALIWVTLALVGLGYCLSLAINKTNSRSNFNNATYWYCEFEYSDYSGQKANDLILTN